MIPAPGAKKFAVAINDTADTILAAAITRIISHNFSFFSRGFNIDTILLVKGLNQQFIRPGTYAVRTPGVELLMVPGSGS